MLRGFILTALTALLALATVGLWLPSPSLIFEAAPAITAMPSLEASRLSRALARTDAKLFTTQVLVSLAFFLALASSRWLIRPFSRRVGAGMLVGALLALVGVAVVWVIGVDVGSARVAAAILSNEQASQRSP